MPVALLVAGMLAIAGTRGDAEDQLAVVETATLTATREAVRVYLHSVYLNDALGTPGLVPLPGERIHGSVAQDPLGRAVAIGTRAGYPRDGNAGESFLSVVNTEPLVLGAEAWVTPDPGWRCVAGSLLRGRDGELIVVNALSPDSPGEASTGRIEVRSAPESLPYTLPAKAAVWLLPGAPAAILRVADMPVVAALCRGPGRVPLLHIRDVTRGEVLREALSLVGQGVRREPVSLAENSDRSLLLALCTGPGANPASARDASWLQAVRLSDMALAGPALEVRGVPLDDPAPMYAAAPDRFWVATREPGLGFAYLTEVAVDADGVRRVAEYSFSDVASSLRIAVDSQGTAVLVGIGTRMEYWKGGKPGGAPATFKDPVGAIAWADNHILVGEGSRLHVLWADTMEVQRTFQLQTGCITGIQVLTAQKQSSPSARNDSDGDGIVDALGPEPGHPTPTLYPQPHIRFRGESAGRQFRAVQLKHAFPDAMRWSLEFNRNELPWLRAYPMSGILPGWFLMGVEARHYEQGQSGGGRVTLHIRREADGSEAAGSPYRIDVKVSPARPTVSRILWMVSEVSVNLGPRDASDPLRLKGLMDLLAGPANHFSHSISRGPLVEPLEDFPLVVLNLPAIAAGAVARQTLLDYVSSGGALLVLGSYEGPEFPEAYTRWLKPAGVVLDAATEVSGTYTGVSTNPLARHCSPLEITEGAALKVEDPFETLVSGSGTPETAVFAIRPFGTGRIAVLASATPLETQSLQQQHKRQFATDLFQWLALAGLDTQDLDGDGLADDMEDRNSDGVLDPGETDRLNPDSDGDGVPDGAEDANRNGVVDDSETSPLTPDSDGDGVYDGADSSPVPQG